MSESLVGLSTREILIAVTVRRLWEADESELRILELCQETNLSTSVIYGHFRSRQGLIDNALMEIFASVTTELLEYLRAAVHEARSSDSFADTLNDLLVDPINEADASRQRQMFFRICATALARPSIRPAFLAIYDDYIERVDAVFEELLARELLRDDLSAHQWALFFEGQMLSRAFHGMTDGGDAANWRPAARALLNVAETQHVC